MQSIELNPAIVAATPSSRVATIIYWVVTGLFCLQMSFTVYALLSLPHMAAVARLRLVIEQQNRSRNSLSATPRAICYLLFAIGRASGESRSD